MMNKNILTWLFLIVISGVLMVGCSKKDSQCSLPHYKDGKFHNLEVEYQSDFSSFLSNVWAFLTDNTPNKIPNEGKIPIVTLTTQDIKNMPDNSVVRIVHSTLLFKLDGQLILTDPVFSKKITPFPFVGPQRFHGLPILIEELPFIDKVIISHNHYDHLDEQSIKLLKDKVGHFYTSTCLKQQLIDWGVDTMKVHELDWWQSISHGSIKITATPAQHFSGRGLFDRDATQWSSWVIQASKAKVFFSGDTGYFQTFKKISEKYGPFDMTFLEAGAYNERWKEIHMMPHQTVQAHLDLKGKVLFPIHNSSFKLGLHPWIEPLEKITKEAKAKDILITHPKFGEIIPLLEYKQTKKWWEN